VNEGNGVGRARRRVDGPEEDVGLVRHHDACITARGAHTRAEQGNAVQSAAAAPARVNAAQSRKQSTST
jgi:hypothetical protein